MATTPGSPVVLITGANSGIGFEAARRIAREGQHVLMASRDREASARAVRAIEDEAGPGRASELGLDLGSPASIRAFAKEIVARDLRIETLVCNAGLQVERGLRTSAEGFELTFGVNHLGHFLLVNLLLRHLLAHAPARVVVVASGVHDPELFTGMPKPDFADLDALAMRGGSPEERFDGRLAYVNSKLCNVWFCYELVRRLEAAGLADRGLAVLGYEPGLVPGSGLARDYSPAKKAIWDYVGPALARVVSPFVASINTAGESGAALARIATDPAAPELPGAAHMKSSTT